MSLVLAVDPGPTQSAWCLYESTANRIRAFCKEANDLVRERMDPLHGFIVGIDDASACHPDHLAVEMIGHYGTGMPAGAEVFETCLWIGRFVERWGGDDFTLVKRHQVKMHLCQSMRAKDPNIRQALIDRFGPPGTKKSPGGTYGLSGDCWAALAVAVTFSDAHPGAGVAP